jgi:hypothetical protein
MGGIAPHILGLMILHAYNYNTGHLSSTPIASQYYMVTPQYYMVLHVTTQYYMPYVHVTPQYM